MVHNVCICGNHWSRTLIREWSPSIEHLICTDANRPPVTVLAEATLSIRSVLQSCQHFWAQIVWCSNWNIGLQVHISTKSASCNKSAYSLHMPKVSCLRAKLHQCCHYCASVEPYETFCRHQLQNNAALFVETELKLHAHKFCISPCTKSICNNAMPSILNKFEQLHKKTLNYKNWI